MEQFIITAQTNGSAEEFYTIGDGISYLTPNFHNAKLFKSEDDAKRELQSPEFTESRRMSDGSINPPRLVHIGAKLNYQKLTGSVTFRVRKLILLSEPIVENTIFAVRLAKG